MITQICPKLPMRNKSITRDFYTQTLDFTAVDADYDGYLIIQKDNLQIHFFEFEKLNPELNYGQIYLRTTDIQSLYNSYLTTNTAIHPNGPLSMKPWGQLEFSILDPDCNLLTFGENLE